MIGWIHRTVRGGMFLSTLLMAALGLAGAVTVTRTAGWQWPVTAWALLTLTPFVGWGLYQRNDRGWVVATSLLMTTAALVVLLVVTPLQIPSAIALSLLLLDLALVIRRLRQTVPRSDRSWNRWEGSEFLKGVLDRARVNGRRFHAFVTVEVGPPGNRGRRKRRTWR